MKSATEGRARRHKIPGDPALADRYIEQNGWGDGLPVIPPTEVLVAAMLKTTPLEPYAVLGRMEPHKGVVTAEKVAANAVMAGCYPEHFPVVVASVKAVLQEQFHVGSSACTTGGAAPVVIVSGPIAERLEINSGTACFGGGYRANASIGRALRLTMRNLGGAKPGGEEKSTHGFPGKMTFCFAENDKRSPWEPLRIEAGFPSEASTVTIVAVRGLYPVCEGTQSTGEGILETIAGAMSALGSPIYNQGARNDVPVVVVLGPEHAAEIARAGYSKMDVKRYLFERTQLPMRVLANRMYAGTDPFPDWVDTKDPNALVPMVAKPDGFIVVVAGGDGRHSAWMPAWNVCEGATELIEELK
ncbi:MAG: hypothetical protein JWN94_3616 [Betaproteobacteria bacterium]|nr:hypothetical protein [Betaproteobacteria bacterium]